MSAARATTRWTLALLAAPLIGLVEITCASAAEDADDTSRIAGRVISVADPSSVSTTMIGVDREDARVAGELVRKVVIEGDVETRAMHGARACTSIGSIGGCGDAPGGAHVEVGAE